MSRLELCACCGGDSFSHADVLWSDLIRTWRLSSDEARYINIQQGTHCERCGSNVRSISLASAIMNFYGFKGTFSEFVCDPRFAGLKILEINRAGSLTQFLDRHPAHTLKEFPEIDMLNIGAGDNEYDLLIHSDTLEHVPDPIRGLSECRRVLKPGGVLAYTVPIIIDRKTMSRSNLEPSYHGNSEVKSEDQLVYTEYGCDAWVQVFQAGFSECRLSQLEFPASIPILAVK